MRAIRTRGRFAKQDAVASGQWREEERWPRSATGEWRALLKQTQRADTSRHGGSPIGPLTHCMTHPRPPTSPFVDAGRVGCGKRIGNRYQFPHPMGVREHGPSLPWPTPTPGMETVTPCTIQSVQNRPSILILGYSEADAVLRSTSRPDVRAILSIHGHREFPVDRHGVARHLVLEFDDCNAPDASDPFAQARHRIRQREADEIGLRMQPPTIVHTQQIVDFAMSIADVGGTLLCQCLAGVGRSPAAALICLASWSGPGEERRCVDHVFSLRPCAIPNESLVQFGDVALNRDGRLLAALREARPG